MALKNAPLITFAALTRSSLALLFSLLALRLIGAYSYGYFTLVWSFGMAFVYMYTGINTVLMTRMVQARGDGNSGLWVGAGLFCTLIASSGIILFAIAFSYLQKTGSIQLSVAYCSLMLVCQLTTLFSCALLEGSGRVISAALLPCLGVSMSCILLLKSLLSATPIQFEIFLQISLIGYALETVISSVWMLKAIKNMPDIRIRKSYLLSLVKGGASIQIANMVSFFLDPFSKGVLVANLGPGAVSIFDISMKMGWGLLSVFSSYARLLLQIQPSDRDLRISSLVKSAEYTWVPATLISALCIVVLPGILGNSMKLNPDLLTIGMGMAFSTCLLMIIVSPVYICLVGFHDHEFILRNQLILAVCNVVAALVLVPALGFVGAFVGGLLGTVINVNLISTRLRRYFPEFSGVWALGKPFAARMAIATVSFIVAWTLSTQFSSLGTRFSVATILLILLVREPLVLFTWQRFSRGKFA